MNLKISEMSPESLNNALVDKMKNSGPDGRYFFVDYTDLRPFNVSAQFISQGIHTTFKRQYNDTVNFNIKQINSTKSKLTAFSISRIAGAYCDDGQNYKNIVTLVKSLGKLRRFLILYKELYSKVVFYLR